MVMVTPLRRPTPEEPALGDSLRLLAVEVRRLSKQGANGGTREVAVLTGHLHTIRERIQHLPTSPLHRWVDNLSRELEGWDDLPDSGHVSRG